jgi:hypothetical protein
VTPRKVVEAWVEAFNRGDAPTLGAMYRDDAINHQVANQPVSGRASIQAMFEDGDWAILEWRDPAGVRGWGFFQVIGSKLAVQRGSWDRLSFSRLHGLEQGA